MPCPSILRPNLDILTILISYRLRLSRISYSLSGIFVGSEVKLVTAKITQSLVGLTARLTPPENHDTTESYRGRQTRFYKGLSLLDFRSFSDRLDHRHFSEPLNQTVSDRSPSAPAEVDQSHRADLRPHHGVPNSAQCSSCNRTSRTPTNQGLSGL